MSAKEISPMAATAPIPPLVEEIAPASAAITTRPTRASTIAMRMSRMPVSSVVATSGQKRGARRRHVWPRVGLRPAAASITATHSMPDTRVDPTKEAAAVRPHEVMNWVVRPPSIPKTSLAER